MTSDNRHGLATIDLRAQFQDVRVACIGDLMLDRFVGGAVTRISPEAPVPVLTRLEETKAPGGGANVAVNIAALGARCRLVGVIGADAAGDDLVAALQATPGIELDLITDSSRPTTEKTRFTSGGQQILRVDRESSLAPDAECEQELIARAKASIAWADIVVISDYAKGALSRQVLRATIEVARESGRKVIVDPKSTDFSRYAGATLVTPNHRELALATGRETVGDAEVETAARLAMEATPCDAMLVTRAEKGVTLIERAGSASHFPARAREVYDVMGAGDTVVAALATSLASGLPLSRSVAIANAAGGLVVDKRGTASVAPEELAEALGVPTPVRRRETLDKTLDRDAALRHVELWRENGDRIGFTNGCFDILHVGHARLIDYARAHCDRLIVAINSDASVRRLKGPDRPFNSQRDRARLLASFGGVDAVVVFDEATPEAVIDAFRPDVLVKGAEYRLEDIVGAQSVLARGGAVLRFEMVPQASTSSTLRRIRKTAEPPARAS